MLCVWACVCCVCVCVVCVCVCVVCAAQSPKVTADELDRRIEAFLEDFRTTLAAMPQADFDRNKAAGAYNIMPALLASNCCKDHAACVWSVSRTAPSMLHTSRAVVRSKLEVPKKPDQLAMRLWNIMNTRGYQFDIMAKEVDCLLTISKEVRTC